ncbi:tRNA-uridine aminocarboxypropyltransferase 1 isoform X2 [Ischnura elegans]|uniref:tRNA-uridine aminocarboxypropyltransferase 1 isoform X2 n=1 Tax=Ischnura elegans TaxID=197161 RepID=UPI001ED87ED9|nr:tRNA-uridine aminocarboxypropyltransferase 1 isoform X2 [Ischnura elegans]
MKPNSFLFDNRTFLLDFLITKFNLSKILFISIVYSTHHLHRIWLGPGSVRLLPIKIDIIKHSREIDGKSTSSHAAVLAPEDVTIYTYPCIPDYNPDENVVLVYPGKDAVHVAEFIKRLGGSQKDDENNQSMPECHRPAIHRAVFIDSTWNQSKGIYKDQRLRGLRCVILENRLSQFWRHQEGSPRWYLATVEAVHEFLLELFKATSAVEYDGQFDNLLFFFRFMFSKIHELYDSSSLKAYKRPLHIDKVSKKRKVKESSEDACDVSG